MGLYDIINEISGSQVTKTDTGDTRLFGVTVGTVAKNYDKDMPGRLCVTIPTRETDANVLQWARMCHPSGGSKWGNYFLPEVGDQVLLAFEGGHIEKPYVIGCVFKDNDKFMTDSVNENNTIKRIGTKNGNVVVFEDNNEGEGEKDKITVQTAGGQYTFLMDNENKKMRLTDKEKENLVEIDTESGAMKVKLKSKLTINVGDKIKVVFNGESGSVKIEADDFRVATTNQVKVKTDGMLSMEGSQISQKASSMFKAESSGMAMITGSPIKIG